MEFELKDGKLKFLDKCIDVDEFTSFYSTHNRAETKKEFGISEFSVREAAKYLGLVGENLRKQKIACKHNYDSYLIASDNEDEIILKIVSNKGQNKNIIIIKRDFVADYKKLTVDELSIKYNISRTCVENLISRLGATNTSEEVQKKKERRGTNKLSNETKEKIKKSLNSKTVRDKISKTNLKKYGCKNSSQNEEIKKKIKDTNLKNHSGCWNLQTEEFREQAKQTSLEKYGVEHPRKSEIVKNKYHSTCQEKYGTEHYSYTEEFVNKARNTSIEKYGVNNPVQKNIKHYDIWQNNDLFIEYIKQLNNGKKPYVIDIANYFNVDSAAIYHRLISFGLQDIVNHDKNHSHAENEIIELLKSKLDIDEKDIEIGNRTILDGKEIDIYLPRYKFGIEFNGDYWHSERSGNYQDNDGRSVKAQNKNLLAETKGVQIFHIFEHEWEPSFNKDYQLTRDKIINRIKNIIGLTTNKVYARKCKIRIVPKEEGRKFVEENHMQGSENHSTIFIGLYYNDELASCMCFGKSKYKKYDYELSRFCNKIDYSIIGGASRLFKYFLKNYCKENDIIVSYSDITKTSGKLYEILGFKMVSVNSPNYWWINTSTCEVRTRYQEQKAGEVQRMHEKGFYRVCDCGTKTWIYKNLQKNGV